jgi:phage-related protein
MNSNYLHSYMLSYHRNHTENEVTVTVNSVLTRTGATCEDTEEEREFRERYAQELRKKRQSGLNNYYGIDELLEERKQVNQQQMKTPGRRGETIKHEEIDREISRRLII